MREDVSSPDSSSVESDDDEVIRRLAELSLLDYERQRKNAAESLGCRENVLDKLVEATRRALNLSDKETLQGQGLNFANVEPWPEPVNGSELLTELADAFSRYIVLPTGAADVLSLWCAHAHACDAFLCFPRLNISSPEKRCGKTTLRDLLALFVPRPLPTENMTLAVLFRTVHLHRPTLLADECDTWLDKNEELRGLLNSGHRKGGQVLRCVGEDYDVRSFEVFGPAVLCGIGSLPGTLQDRSIMVRLTRAKSGEVCERFDSRRTEREHELCRKLVRFCLDHRTAFEVCDPTLPPEAFNRLADNWRPLFAVAEVAGGEWPQRANNAFASLVSKEDSEAQGIGTMLLADIQLILSESGAERIFSGVIVGDLCAMTDRPWAETNRGRPITENWLARRLLAFGIKPKTLRIKPERAKGYEAAEFTEAFERYLGTSDLSNRDTVTSEETSVSGESYNRDNDQVCHGSESVQTPVETDLSRCHGSETKDQRCPFCKEIGLTVHATGNNGSQRIEKRCMHCRELVESYVPA